jgi:hypothetical protein
MKTRTLQLSLIATAMLALSAIASPAFADTPRSEWRQDTREIRQDQRELRGDYRELAEDRADYQRARARGDVVGMFRERMEIRQDKQEILRDQAELRHDLRDRRQDARAYQNHDGRNRHAGYWNQGQRGSWGEQRHDNRVAFRQDRQEHRQEFRETRRDNRPEQTQAAQAQRVNWQAPGRQQSAQATSTPQNNGRHSGGQQGRGSSRGS